MAQEVVLPPRGEGEESPNKLCGHSKTTVKRLSVFPPPALTSRLVTAREEQYVASSG